MDLGAAWRHVDLVLVFLIMLVFAGGIIFYALVKAGAGRAREVSWLMWALAAALIAAYALLPRLRH